MIEGRRDRERWKESPIRKRAQVLRGGVADRSRRLGLPIDSELKSTKWWVEKLEAQPACACCGTQFDLQGGKHSGRMGPSNESPTADRVVPHLGYTVANTAILCWRCNNLKRDATAEELMRIAQWMTSWGNQLDAA